MIANGINEDGSSKQILPSVPKLMFSDQAEQLLESMKINVYLYKEQLVSKYKCEAILFGKLLDHFEKHSSSELSTAEFNLFVNRMVAEYREMLQDHLYDLFNYLRLFREGGAFFLYKHRQAEWSGPPVILGRDDVPPGSDVESLNPEEEIYRGMCRDEFEQGTYGQSWTKVMSVARRFAFDTYSDHSRGVVAKCIIRDANPIYYSETDTEAEVIVAFGSVSAANIVET